ncbi:hypothetical protein [Stenotrophomonas sp. Iso1]|uniref:hypothetical protein n=1 Tax=Stenotrophomonas sp. Iso1 TaxID=2977283 RepID=UPI0022B777D8|nr:hypothetical protein [Stenotrophomonas sp. Iso1]
MKAPELPPANTKRSSAETFVDVTAKLSMVMAALAILWGLIQLVLVLALSRLDMLDVMQSQGLPLPEAFQWIGRHALSLTALMLGVSIAFFLVSWAMFKRREWGRLGFIVFLVLVALLNFASLPFIHSLFDSMRSMFPAEFLQSAEGMELRAQLNSGLWMSLFTGAITAIAFAGLHGWLVIKLQRPDVRALFH